MRPHVTGWTEPEESVPTDVLFPDLLRRAVSRALVGDGDEAAAAPEVRIVTLAVCDRSLPIGLAPSAAARVLDWLAWQHGLVFLVSAGNAQDALELPVRLTVLDSLAPAAVEALTIERLILDAHNRRLLSPAESVNALTIGAAHDDASQADAAPLFELVDAATMASPISRVGGGLRRSIKPDVLAPGGRQPYRDAGAGDGRVRLLPTNYSRPPGQEVASPGSAAGQLDATRFTRGTSTATAYAARAAAGILEVVAEDLLDGSRPVDRGVEAALVKALLVHSACWGEAFERVSGVFAADGLTAVRTQAARLLGYGRIDPFRSVECSDERVTLVGYGHLGDGDGHIYSVPLPASLSGVAAWRRLTLTLAWLSPINVRHRSYRRAQLWFDPPRDELGVSRQDAEYRAAQRGTLQHEVLEGRRAAAYGTDEVLEVHVSCRADAGVLADDVPYAIAVTLEVAPELRLPIYEQVAARVRAAVAIRPRP
jgi:hypothetical protein